MDKIPFPKKLKTQEDLEILSEVFSTFGENHLVRKYIRDMSTLVLEILQEDQSSGQSVSRRKSGKKSVVILEQLQEGIYGDQVLTIFEKVISSCNDRFFSLMILKTAANVYAAYLLKKPIIDLFNGSFHQKSKHKNVFHDTILASEKGQALVREYNRKLRDIFYPTVKTPTQ